MTLMTGILFDKVVVNYSKAEKQKIYFMTAKSQQRTS